ncbi:unnamed protein product [Prorocentrum cordatum]|uniref:C3H1-type domain-containing protein n=1 Tax=Prorocentrum cordatum TaxID=2364126 RepID=A0ABN9VMR9_9DINO|nr:unnamed protein product [Polarella glacialis]
MWGARRRPVALGPVGAAEDHFTGGGCTSLGLVGGGGGGLTRPRPSCRGAAPTPPRAGSCGEAPWPGPPRCRPSRTRTARRLPSTRGTRTGPVLGSAVFPSRGSALHQWGVCKPCAFVFQAGCNTGVDCQFCHLCEPGERKRRKKERVAKRRVAHATADRDAEISEAGTGELPGRL